jgi:hypothetical protein
MDRYFGPLKMINNLKKAGIRKVGVKKPHDPIMDFEIDTENDPLDTWFYHLDSTS